jgi:RNA polymerase sigma-70 factor (ECF subfamily)
MLAAITGGSRGPAMTTADGRPSIVNMPEDFETFYQREFRQVVALAYSLSGSRLAAEDLAQEAFIAAHQQWEKVGRYEAPGAWVRRVVSNKSISLFRKRTSEAKAVTRIAMHRQVPLPEMAAPDDEFWRFVRDLPKRQAQAIALFYLEDRPVAEVAEILDCTESTAKVHLHKGRKALAKRLKLEEGESL